MVMSHKDTITQRSRRARQRSLSPFSARFVKDYTSRLAQRTRSRSPPRRHRNDEAKELIANFNADMERRKQLTPEKRLEEDGQALSSALKKRPNTLLTLQYTPQVLYRRARCRAQECLYGPSDGIYAAEIHDKYRIALEWDGRSPPEYYHVRCMECMISLADLAHSQFKLEGGSTWRLMVGKWLEHRGRINIEKIVAYIDRATAYSQWHGETIDEISRISLHHQASCALDPPLCGCPEFPKGPKVPVLKDYITDESYKLWDTICHPYENKGWFFYDDSPPWRFDPPGDLETDVEGNSNIGVVVPDDINPPFGSDQKGIKYA